MKKTIKIKITDWWAKYDNTDYTSCFVISSILKFYNIEYCNKNPDYLICGPYGYDFLNYPNSIKILLTGENGGIDFDLYDYIVGYDYINFEDRYSRIPFSFLDTKNCDIKAINSRVLQCKYKDKFCAYMVSEPTSFSKRHDFFEELSKYKKVDSGGRYANNIGGPIGDRYGSDFTASKLEWLKKYKFNICFENSKQNGYLTEKIFHAFAAGCIPIYCGDPTIDKIINPRSYINVDNFKTFNEAIEFIKYIDNNDDLFQKMINEQVFIKNEDYIDIYNKKLQDFLVNIFNQDLINAKRLFPNLRNQRKISMLKSALKPTFKQWWKSIRNKNTF